MSDEKIQRIERARKSLTKAGVEWKEFNDSYHFKIGKLDFWPSTGKWISGNDEGRGLDELLRFLKPRNGKAKVLTVEQIFDIAKKVKPLNLHDVCEAIHKEIYK